MDTNRKDKFMGLTGGLMEKFPAQTCQRPQSA